MLSWCSNMLLLFLFDIVQMWGTNPSFVFFSSNFPDIAFVPICSRVLLVLFCIYSCITGYFECPFWTYWRLPLVETCTNSRRIIDLLCCIIITSVPSVRFPNQLGWAGTAHEWIDGFYSTQRWELSSHCIPWLFLLTLLFCFNDCSLLIIVVGTDDCSTCLYPLNFGA